jgi:hypothetical protein
MDWLFTPAQRLLELTAGEVFEDPAGLLTPLRATLSWYPHDVWLFAIARQWRRIAQEESFAGRCAEAADDAGWRTCVARMVRELMRLCFLLERRYAPYAKWLSAAFARLECGRELTPALEDAMESATYDECEASLAWAFEYVGALHNALAVTPPVEPRIRAYHDRPYRVPGADRFAAATLDALDPAFRARHEHIPGTIDQIVDNTDVLTRPAAWRTIRAAYESEPNR